jgi:hypothetical protein
MVMRTLTRDTVVDLQGLAPGLYIVRSDDYRGDTPLPIRGDLPL